MIIVLKHGASKEEIDHVVQKIKEYGLTPHVSAGKERTIIGVIGDERIIQNLPLSIFPGVEKVMPILSPYKLVSREFKGEDTQVTVGPESAGIKIGGKRLHVMAGPCAVESLDRLMIVAEAVRAAGATILRGGAFKPRTSPYTFQGLGAEGLDYLIEAKKKTGLPIVTEVLDTRDVELVAARADILQIGTRNMQNFRLLTEVGQTDKPIMLKRGLSATIKEFLLSAEYIMSRGNHRVMLCERGIRTFETQTRNTLDLSAVPILKSLSHLPVIVDPSHATGKWELVTPMAKAAVAAGADGLMIEVHANPEEAYSDGEESLKPPKFLAMMQELRKVAAAVGREL
jgi:3-deoxy-7-phosphoheptulonate synthase